MARQRILEVRALLRSSNRQATAPPRTIPDEPPPPAVKPVRQGNEDFKAAVGDRVFFDRGSAKLGPSGLNVVRAQAQWLSAHPDTIVTLEGHAEDDDSAEIEQVIALERAEAVKLHLMKEGIAPGRIHIEARGRSRPVALCREHRSARATTPAAAVAAEACFAHNRRVVSIVTSGVDRDGRRVAQDNGRKDMSPSELTPGDDKKPALKSQPRASEWTRTLPQ